MGKIKTIVLLAAAFLVFFAMQAGAESKKYYRYTDSSGKTLYANSLEEIPAELRPSATSVVVHAEDENGGKDDSTKAKTETTEKDKEKDAVRFTTQLKYSGAETDKTAFEGEVKNFLDSSVSDAKLTIVIVAADGSEKSFGPFSVIGEKGSGNLEPGESAKVSGVFDFALGSIKKVGSSLSWQTFYVEKESPKKPSDNRY